MSMTHGARECGVGGVEGATCCVDNSRRDGGSGPSDYLLEVAIITSEVVELLTYRAMYKYVDDGIHAEVLDFPGVITSAQDLDEAISSNAGLFGI